MFIRDLLQPWHLLIVLAIILLIFGPGKLSGLGSALGSSIRDFKKATREDDDVGGEKTTSGNVNSVADDDAPVAALPAKSVVIESTPMSRRSTVDLDDDDTMAVPAGGGTNGPAPIKVGTTRKGYSRR